MKMAKKIVFAGILMTGMLLVSACRHPFYHGSSDEKFDWFAEKLVDYLDMNDEQQKALMSMRDDYTKESAELHRKRMKILSLISDQLRSSVMDTASLEQAIREKNKLEQRLENLFIKKAAEMHQILTAEQRYKLADKLDEIIKKHQEYRSE